MEIGTIKAVHIYVHEQLYVSAELELNLKGVNHSFGGHLVFLSGMNGGEPCDAPFLGRFLFRCMQICDVESWDQLKSNKVLVKIANGKVVAIGHVSGSKWFNPESELKRWNSKKKEATFIIQDQRVNENCKLLSIRKEACRSIGRLLSFYLFSTIIFLE